MKQAFTWSAEESQRLLTFYRKAIATPSYSGQEEQLARLTEAWMKELGYDRVFIDSAGNVARYRPSRAG